MLIVNGDATCEVENEFGVHAEWLTNVADLGVKSRDAHSEIAQVARHQIVEPDHLETFGQEAVNQMRSKKARSTGNERGRTYGSESHAPKPATFNPSRLARILPSRVVPTCAA